MPIISDTLTVSIEPAGASVYLKRFAADESGAFPPRRLVGTTPIKEMRVARGDYVLTVEREGYATFERTISSALCRAEGKRNPGVTIVEGKLVESARVPERMTFVPGGKYRLVGWGRPTEASVQLDDFFIDKYEVSNREFKEFVAAGGYLKREFWRHRSSKDGREISWRRRRARCATARAAGPRTLSNGNPPEGKENHPVTNVTW